MLELLEINEEYEVSTVNGWVMHELGKVPEEGDAFKNRAVDSDCNKSGISQSDRDSCCTAVNRTIR